MGLEGNEKADLAARNKADKGGRQVERLELTYTHKEKPGQRAFYGDYQVAREKGTRKRSQPPGILYPMDKS